MKHILATTCLAAGLGGLGVTTAAAECGDVTIASMNWQSAEVLASLDQFILNEGYGCNAAIIQGDTVPTITAMAEKGDPDIAPEGWVDLIPEVVNRGITEGRLVGAALAISDGAVQGWWVPKYIVEANPDIKTIDDALKHPELFPDPDDSSKGAVHNGPQGWGGTVVTTQLFKAYGAEEAGFRLIDTGSAAGLDGSIARAYERREGWVGYYWSPTALLGRYEMVKLDHGVDYGAAEWTRCNTVAECPDPTKNNWPSDTVQTLVTASFAERAGDDVMAYLKTRSWSNATVNALMAWMTDNQATGEDGARHFLKENEGLWTQWVSPEVAEKVKAALE
ncbi:ABC transporter substrate-binding protein [Mesorhizobium sp. L-8-10]|uniref:ABC transporter substrate-binding protein n=1 Tax=Mesorhizobium sp. L-8-10 TaxID=2744523 RepID=UPI00192849C4|nr:ABC transporter substrate-binding protein [Mesorhizobium sp. L-8-10]BCH35766.1 ABC transporter substrate-binding protein [Mesorhizobium sp. L-8-10]